LKKKRKSKALWVVLIIIALIIGFISFIPHFASRNLISDNMQYYDDFNGGFRSDLWQTQESTSERAGLSCRCSYSSWCTLSSQVEIDNIGILNQINVQNGKLNLINNGIFTCISKSATVTSRKLFSTEDIKFRVTADVSKKSGAGGIYYKTVSISYGKFSIPLAENCIRQSSDMLSCTIDDIIEIKRYDDLDLSKFVVLRNGIEVANGVNTQPEPLIFVSNGDLWIDEVKFQPYFSCAIDYNTEVVVRDRFSSNSQVNIDSLTYQALKFCPQDLGVLIFSDKGLTDEKGSITTSIAEGKTLTVPSGQYWQIDYITKYVTDMKEKCGLGYVYDTNLKKCVSQVFQQVDTNKLLYCDKDSDCILPSKCNDATVKCISNQCDYSSTVCTPEQIINYIEVIKTIDIIQPQIIIIPQSQNEYAFSVIDKVTIAEKDFIVSEPVALKDKSECKVSRGEFLSPSKLGCYKVHVIWEDFDFDILNGETKILNDYVSVTWNMGGQGVFNGGDRISKEWLANDNGVYACRSLDSADNLDYQFIKKCFPYSVDYTNNFKISFTNIFDISIQGYKEKIKPSESNTITFNVDNKLWNLNSGKYYTKISKELIDVFSSTDFFNKVIPYGKSSYSIPMDSSTLGIVNLETGLAFDIAPNIPYIDDKIYSIGYYVTSDPEYLNCKQTDCIVGECQSDGNCLVTQTNIITYDCRDKGCVSGTCNVNTGVCEKTDYIYIDCKTKPCPSDYSCNVDGVCEKTITIIQNCKQLRCPSGYTCSDLGVCNKTKITYETPTFIWAVIGALFLIIVSIIVYFTVKKK